MGTSNLARSESPPETPSQTPLNDEEANVIRLDSSKENADWVSRTPNGKQNAEDWVTAIRSSKNADFVVEESFLSEFHYGPGPHPDGSPQSVHGGKKPHRIEIRSEEDKPPTSVPIAERTLKDDMRDWYKKGYTHLQSVARDDRMWLVNAAGNHEKAQIIAGYLADKYPGEPVSHLHKTFSFVDEPSGYKTELETMELHGHSLHVAGVVLDASGRKVAEFERQFYPDLKQVDHHLFEFKNKSAEKSGFGTRFIAHLERHYREWGVETVTLNANIDVGGYAWARMGFDFQVEKTRQAHVDDFLDFYRKIFGHDYLRDYPKPHYAWEIASATGPMLVPYYKNSGIMQNGRYTWEIRGRAEIGKAYMLGQSWFGIKYLTNDSLHQRIAGLYYRMNERKVEEQLRAKGKKPKPLILEEGSGNVE